MDSADEHPNKRTASMATKRRCMLGFKDEVPPSVAILYLVILSSDSH
jgi:hypothetical protein